MKNAFRTSILGFVTILIVSGVLLAQSDLGTISGFVRDPSGASIPNAMVTIKNQTGIERQTTNEDNRLLAPVEIIATGVVQKRERLGGLLNYYYRKAA